MYGNNRTRNIPLPLLRHEVFFLFGDFLVYGNELRDEFNYRMIRSGSFLGVQRRIQWRMTAIENTSGTVREQLPYWRGSTQLVKLPPGSGGVVCMWTLNASIAIGAASGVLFCSPDVANLETGQKRLAISIPALGAFRPTVVPTPPLRQHFTPPLHPTGGRVFVRCCHVGAVGAATAVRGPPEPLRHRRHGGGRRTASDRAGLPAALR